MLAISTQNQCGIFEKVLRGKDGHLYSIRFVVTEVAGQIRARVISASPIETLSGGCSTEKRGCLPLFRDSSPETFFDLESPAYTTPFVSELGFLTSQLARAPSSV